MSLTVTKKEVEAFAKAEEAIDISKEVSRTDDGKLRLVFVVAKKETTEEA